MNRFSNLHSFQKDPYNFFDRHKPADLTKPVSLNLGLHKLFICYDPNLAQHMLQDQRSKYEKSSLVLRKIKSLSGPTGLIQLKDPEAQRVRQMSAQLMTPEKMARLLSKINDFTQELFPLIDKSIRENKSLDLAPHLTRIVLRTAGIFVMNQDLGSESEILNNAFVELNRKAGKSLRSIMSNPISVSKIRSLKIIHSQLSEIIDKNEFVSEPSLLKSLLSNRENKSFIQDQLKAFLFAGYDTTASSLIFAMHLVASNNHVQNEIAKEARTIGTLNFENLKKSKLVQSTYKETLRLYPSAYFLPRETNQPDNLGGVLVPKQSQVFLSVRHIQRHPDYFDAPNEFKADRFLSPIKHPFAFIPFGGGPRICIGAALAKLEATAVIQTVCRHYEMQPVSNEPPKIEALITAHTKSPLLVNFKKRSLPIEKEN